MNTIDFEFNKYMNETCNQDLGDRSFKRYLKSKTKDYYIMLKHPDVDMKSELFYFASRNLLGTAIDINNEKTLFGRILSNVSNSFTNFVVDGFNEVKYDPDTSMLKFEKCGKHLLILGWNIPNLMNRFAADTGYTKCLSMDDIYLSKSCVLDVLPAYTVMDKYKFFSLENVKMVFDSFIEVAKVSLDSVYISYDELLFYTTVMVYGTLFRKRHNIKAAKTEVGLAFFKENLDESTLPYKNTAELDKRLDAMERLIKYLLWEYTIVHKLSSISQSYGGSLFDSAIAKKVEDIHAFIKDWIDTTCTDTASANKFTGKRRVIPNNKNTDKTKEKAEIMAAENKAKEEKHRREDSLRNDGFVKVYETSAYDVWGKDSVRKVIIKSHDKDLLARNFKSWNDIEFTTSISSTSSYNKTETSFKIGESVISLKDLLKESIPYVKSISKPVSSNSYDMANDIIEWLSFKKEFTLKEAEEALPRMNDRYSLKESRSIVAVLKNKGYITRVKTKNKNEDKKFTMSESGRLISEVIPASLGAMISPVFASWPEGLSKVLAGKVFNSEDFEVYKK